MFLSICYVNRFICLCFPILLNDKSDETPAQVARKMQKEDVLRYLLNDNAYGADVSSDGDANAVNVSTSTGMFLPTLR